MYPTDCLYTVDHPDTILKLKDDDTFALREIFRQKRGEETEITYSLDVLIQDKEAVSKLLLLEDEESIVHPYYDTFLLLS